MRPNNYKSERGAVLVEYAIALPIMAVLIICLYWFFLRLEIRRFETFSILNNSLNQTAVLNTANFQKEFINILKNNFAANGKTIDLSQSYMCPHSKMPCPCYLNQIETALGGGADPNSCLQDYLGENFIHVRIVDDSKAFYETFRYVPF